VHATTHDAERPAHVFAVGCNLSVREAKSSESSCGVHLIAQTVA
jgi:hypothetical protein